MTAGPRTTVCRLIVNGALIMVCSTAGSVAVIMSMIYIPAIRCAQINLAKTHTRTHTHTHTHTHKCTNTLAA